MTPPAAATAAARFRDVLAPPLCDAQGRVMTYLRLSVTDRCNFRCAYCSPAHWGGTKDLLQPAELERFTQVFARLGIKRVRLTGGEPLLRPDILEVASRVASVQGIDQVAMTTNASRLTQLAAPLRDAGISQLNVSLDTLREDTFRRISARGELGEVLLGIDAAASASFASVKLNVVVMKGVNEDEAPAIVRYAHARKITPRFIELMPFGKGEGVPTRELVERLRDAGVPLAEDDGPKEDATGPARYYRAPGGKVGFVSPMTENFCGGCNRVRVSAKGELRSCLGGRSQAPLAQLLRGGATDEDLAFAIRRALGEKQDGHRFNDPKSSGELLSMMGIGG